MEYKFHAGELAQIKSTGEIVTISSVNEGLRHAFYIVFQNGKKNRYKEEELTSYVDVEEELYHKIENEDYANAESFQKYAYYRLFSENQDGNLFSYQGNRILFNPFQYKPLLKFLSVGSEERLLIADEVGVGKTIESGIIIDELLSRGELQNNDTILIVCPSILCEKWRNELRQKFSLDDFWVHDGNSLKYFLSELKESGRIQYSHSIVSEQLFRGVKFQNMLQDCLDEIGEPFFKLLIVDECHHYRNPATNTHKFGALLSVCSERVIMLSATPFNLRSDDLYNQLHILNPTLFPDKLIFSQLLSQIRRVNQSIALIHNDDEHSRIELSAIVGSLKPFADENDSISQAFEPLYLKIVKGQKLSPKEIVDFENVVSRMNPISSSFTRTLKRDALEHRVTRDTMTLEVHFSAEESDIYNTFLDTNLKRYRLMGISDRAFGLILNGLERIAASSIAALERNVKKYINMSETQFLELMSDEIELDADSAKAMLQMLKDNYADLSVKIRQIEGKDSKYDTFKQLISNIQQASSDNTRIIVFSFYTETLKYLRKRLAMDGFKVGMMYGQTPYDTPSSQNDEDGFKVVGRNEVMQHFKDGEYEILLVSEVGGEGLDFQFCSSLINYDLPYNPMRIEQRIGRIDRMGQKADKIIIGNLCIKNTIDEVINRVLLSRIANAADLVGELEPIIAQKLIEINELIITKDFNEAELKQREIEIQNRIEKARQTREEFDVARYDLVNDKGFREEFEESVNRSRITPHESLLYTNAFLKKENGCYCKKLSDTSAVIHVSKDICGRIRAYVRKMNFGKSGEELQKLLDGNGDLRIEFDGSKAYDSPDFAFYKPSGAWIRFITSYIRAEYNENSENLFCFALHQKNFTKICKGTYWLFVYEMSFKGFFHTKTYEYLLCSGDGSFLYHLSEDEKKLVFQTAEITKYPTEDDIESFDNIKFAVEDYADKIKEQISSAIMENNAVKITSRIQAVQNLSDMQIRKLEDRLIGTIGKEEEKIRKSIDKEKSKTAEKISILKQKLQFVGTYALDSISRIEIVE